MAKPRPNTKFQSRKVSPARVAVFEALRKIEEEKAFSSIVLPALEDDLRENDRGLCHEITLGVIRHRILLDRQIEKLTGKPAGKFDLAVLLALRIGLYQLFFLDRIPARAAINESVNLVHRAKKRSAAGLVNAVLRRAAGEGVPALDFADRTEKISVETSHPRWLVEKWIKQFGLAETEQLARANNQMPQLAFRPTAKSDFSPSDLLRRPGLAGLVERSANVENCFLTSGSSEILRELAGRGEIYFQDEASQLVAAAVRLKDDEKFLDVCAAPGSKTTLIGAGLKEAGTSLLIAGDLYFPRVKFLRENCVDQKVENVSVMQYDAEWSLPFADHSFDVVLLDAPCSGTGTIRHNPEIRFFLKENDFADLSGKQLGILQNASKLVKSGGRLIYSTCSLEHEENEAVIETFLAENKRFAKAFPAVPEKFLTAEGFARTFPHRDRMDGFFIVLLEAVR